jgi:hypothetical protein
MMYLIPLQLPTIWTHPTDRHEPAILPDINPLHLDRAGGMMAEQVLNIWHGKMYTTSSRNTFVKHSDSQYPEIDDLIKHCQLCAV